MSFFTETYIHLENVSPVIFVSDKHPERVVLQIHFDQRVSINIKVLGLGDMGVDNNWLMQVKNYFSLQSCNHAIVYVRPIGRT